MRHLCISENAVVRATPPSRSQLEYAAVAVFLMLLAWETLSTWRVPIQSTILLNKQDLALSSGSSTYRQTAVGAFQAHPLFIASRMPWMAPPPHVAPTLPVKTEAVQASLPVPRGFVLVGTTLSPLTRIALIRGPDAHTLRLMTGSSLEGWKVIRINGDAITLGANGRVYNLAFAGHGDQLGGLEPTIRTAGTEVARQQTSPLAHDRQQN